MYMARENVLFFKFKILARDLKKVRHPWHRPTCSYAALLLVRIANKEGHSKISSNIHLFIPDISMPPLQVHYYSKGAPDDSIDTPTQCWS